MRQEKQLNFSHIVRMKRRNLSGGEDGRQVVKSQRRDEEQQQHLELEDQPWEVRAGMILEVNLRNFMCHEVKPFLSASDSVPVSVPIPKKVHWNLFEQANLIFNTELSGYAFFTDIFLVYIK
jgi:hypothetical protein